MNDPAIEAAQRAMNEVHGNFYPNRDQVLAAREALKPIRELWWREMGADNAATYNERVRRIFDGLSPLIFTAEEVEGSPGE